MMRYRIIPIISGSLLAAFLVFSVAAFIYAQGEGVPPAAPPVPEAPSTPQQNQQPASEGGWFSINNFINGGNAIDSVAILCGIAATVRSYGLPFAVFAIVILGLRLVIAAASGNPGELQQTKKWLVYAIVGAAIVAAAVVLVSASVNFIGSISGTGSSCG